MAFFATIRFYLFPEELACEAKQSISFLQKNEKKNNFFSVKK
ncbi:hypothetical protein RV09_GL002132 [Enterococcus moraviensis]|nr:hypothetical protein RV09_GL002132 [Enterococcus moraviensis]